MALQSKCAGNQLFNKVEMKNLRYILFACSVLLLSCDKDAANNTNELLMYKEPKTQNEQGSSQKLNEQPLEELEDHFISVRGFIDVPPENRAAISPFYGGFVKSVDVLPGQQVSKGEVLFTLQNPDYLKIQQEYLEVKEQLEYLKSDFERQKMLSEEHIASTKNYKKAQSEYRMMLAKLKGLDAQITMMGISIEDLEAGRLFNTIIVRSPISGSVTEVSITKSAYIDAKEIAVELINTDHIHLELQVFEKDVLKIHEGQEIQFTVPEVKGKHFEGRVYLVGQSIDFENRTVLVHGHIHEEVEVDFIPGMFVEAKIVLN